jgi:hypothetical protein
MSKFTTTILFVIAILSSYSKCCSQEDSEFSPVSMQSGQTPACYQFRQSSDSKIDNFLKVNVGGDADVVLKLISQSTDECIRYVYVTKDDTYFIRNIPAGVYYVKIAFGNKWGESKLNSGCVAKFLENNVYQIGNDLLEFNPVENYEGVQIPSYELILKTYSNNRLNEFNAEDISEEEFNK